MLNADQSMFAGRALGAVSGARAGLTTMTMTIMTTRAREGSG